VGRLTKLTALIKKVALDAFHASKPTSICFGNVVSTNPLSVRINQLIVLSSATLIPTSAVKDKLAVGDEVILIRQQGGQKYVVLDKYEVNV
jgi:hypothetical protein